ncbi:MAG: prokaryotic E2 ligase family D protein [Chloroflexi bacterium]|nr:prokaryotic E2 ligase family D protein [Chloroflexota bacterium]MCI0728598.1 prokaryotic E2 ligase family D protein [Chloroflexota bacterium]
MNQQAPHTPRLRLDFYQTDVLMSRWEEDGRVTTYPVAIHDVVSACARVELGSGLLPPGVLFWKQQAGQLALGLHVPARRWRVQCDAPGGQGVKSYHVPMPPLVFAGRGMSYHVFAVKKRPEREGDRLYHAPCPNVQGYGAICPGNTPFPVCSPQSIQTALRLFMEGSLFDAHLSGGKCRRYPDDVRRLWLELEGKKSFPLAELVATGRTLRELL